MAAVQAFGGATVARAQEAPDCEAVAIGSLGEGGGSELSISGRWSGEDCD